MVGVLSNINIAESVHKLIVIDIMTSLTVGYYQLSEDI